MVELRDGAAGISIGLADDVAAGIEPVWLAVD
jgi:hypothetical protein